MECCAMAGRVASILAGAVAASLLFSWLPDSASAAYLAKGRLRVLAVDSGGPDSEIDRTKATGVLNEDTAAVSAPLNNTASGWYRVDIPSAEMAVGAQVDAGDPGITGRYSGTNTYIDLDLSDQMQCTISVGSYPDGVFVRSTAVISGQVHASGGDGATPSPHADLQLSLSMGAATAGQGVYPQVTPNNSPLVLRADTSLVHQLVAPGTTYLSPVIVNLSVIGHLVLNTSTPSHENAWSGAGGNPSIHLTPMLLSASGVTCSSDSGVFLTEPIALPGLGAFGVLLAVLALSSAGILMLRRAATPQL